jgi:hypothetical protein
MKITLPITETWTGTVTGNGVIDMHPLGTPAQLIADAERAYINTVNTPTRMIQCLLAASATIDMEGCEGNPLNEDDWVLIDTVTTSEFLQDDAQRTNIRFVAADVTDPVTVIVTLASR